jgi:hypothetical protein
MGLDSTPLPYPEYDPLTIPGRGQLRSRQREKARVPRIGLFFFIGIS